MPISLVDGHLWKEDLLKDLITPQIQIVLLALRQKNIQQELSIIEVGRYQLIRSQTLFFNLGAPFEITLGLCFHPIHARVPRLVINLPEIVLIKDLGLFLLSNNL